jgi:hypothetical protein
VAAADDHRVVALGHEPLHPLCIEFMHRVAEGRSPDGRRSAWRPRARV